MTRFTLDEVIQKELKNPKFAAHYERELIINGIAQLVVNLRQKADLTQQELAEKIGSSQSAIARLESGTDSRMPSLDLLGRIAAALHAKLNISFELQKR